MFTRLAYLRLVLSDDKSLMREFDGVFRDWFASIVSKMLGEDRLEEEPVRSLIDSSSSYAWSKVALNMLHKNKRYLFGDVLSEVYEKLDSIEPSMLSLVGRDSPWEAIAKMWYRYVQARVVDVIRFNNNHQQSEDDKPIEPLIHYDEFVEDVVEDQLSALRSVLRHSAKSPEDAKLFLMLLDAMIDNDYFTEQGKKKFVGVLQRLPHNAPEPKSESFWRGVWDKMRPVVCRFFTSVFKQQDVSMTHEQKKLVCSSVNVIANRIVRESILRSMSAYVLGM